MTRQYAVLIRCVIYIAAVVFPSVQAQQQLPPHNHQRQSQLPPVPRDRPHLPPINGDTASRSGQTHHAKLLTISDESSVHEKSETSPITSVSSVQQEPVALPPHVPKLPPQEPKLPPQEPALPQHELKLPPQEPKLPPHEPKLPQHVPKLPPRESRLPPTTAPVVSSVPQDRSKMPPPSLVSARLPKLPPSPRMPKLPLKAPRALQLKGVATSPPRRRTAMHQVFDHDSIDIVDPFAHTPEDEDRDEDEEATPLYLNPVFVWSVVIVVVSVSAFWIVLIFTKLRDHQKTIEILELRLEGYEDLVHDSGHGDTTGHTPRQHRSTRTPRSPAYVIDADAEHNHDHSHYSSDGHEVAPTPYDDEDVVVDVQDDEECEAPQKYARTSYRTPPKGHRRSKSYAPGPRPRTLGSGRRTRQARSGEYETPSPRQKPYEYEKEEYDEPAARPRHSRYRSAPEPRDDPSYWRSSTPEPVFGRSSLHQKMRGSRRDDPSCWRSSTAEPRGGRSSLHHKTRSSRRSRGGPFRGRQREDEVQVDIGERREKRRYDGERHVGGRDKRRYDEDDYEHGAEYEISFYEDERPRRGGSPFAKRSVRTKRDLSPSNGSARSSSQRRRDHSSTKDLQSMPVHLMPSSGGRGRGRRLPSRIVTDFDTPATSKSKSKSKSKSATKKISHSYGSSDEPSNPPSYRSTNTRISGDLENAEHTTELDDTENDMRRSCPHSRSSSASPSICERADKSNPENELSSSLEEGTD